MGNKKLLIVVDTDWFFLSHRLPIAIAAVADGLSVSVLATDTGHSKEITKHDINFVPFDFRRNGLNPLTEVKIIYKLQQVYKQLKPDIVHHVSMKIIMNGIVACKLAGISYVINAVTGMGSYFLGDKKKFHVKWLFSPILKLGKRFSSAVFIFQNEDDKNLFFQSGWANENQCVIIQGSGVNLDKMNFSNEPSGYPVKVLIATRLIKDKGIHELIEAAKILKPLYKDKVEFILAGKFVEENPSRIRKEDILQWVDDGIITYIGYQSDMYPHLVNSHVNVLPSYSEGLPKSLIEACAIGRPIVTTDVPGCRDVVEDNVNGFLVPVKSVQELADAIGKLIENPELRQDMGKASRKKAEEQFDLQIVVKKTLNIYRNFCA